MIANPALDRPRVPVRVVDYLGVLDDAHVHAAIRVALRAHGFEFQQAASAHGFVDDRALGARVVDEIFQSGPAFVDCGDLARLHAADARLSQRLPLMAALGWRHVEALVPLAGEPLGADIHRAKALGAAFNAAISVLDYVVDEHPHGGRVFAILDAQTIAAIFDRSVDVEPAFEALYRTLDDPRLRVLVALVAHCAREGRALATVGNDEAWQGLGRLVVRLREAQQLASLTPETQAAELGPSLLAAFEAKSALPSVAMLYIAQLLGRGAPSPDALSAASALGRIFWRVDDASDLLEDCRRGVASALVLRLTEIVSAEGRELAADADLYRVIDEAAGDIVRHLERCGAARAFARTCVAAWVAWQVDAPAPHRPRQATHEAIAMGALDALLAAQRNDFREATHHLRFPRADLRHETHGAVLSFRAVALDALLDARDAGLPVPERALNVEALRILQAKHPLVRGGWNYVAAVPELPPDADDNGQVLQVLARLGGLSLAATCDEPIRLLLDATGPDGGVPTWAIDPRGDTPADAAVQSYLPIMGGWGVHPEVVANFAFGLLLYDAARFMAPLRRIASYLEGAQTADGSWTSAWYGGPHYGTFRATAVLRQVVPASPSIERARAFVLARQRSDGGWGNEASDPLSTALALLVLDEVGVDDYAVCRRAVDYLRTGQAPDGAWPATAWIRFPTVGGEVVYGSRTMTTAFCLKALTVPHGPGRRADDRR